MTVLKAINPIMHFTFWHREKLIYLIILDFHMYDLFPTDNKFGTKYEGSNKTISGNVIQLSQRGRKLNKKYQDIFL